MPEGIGALLVMCASRMLALPLEAVRVDTTVADHVATVTMVQTWWNPYPQPLEAVYVFPLSGDAAVGDFALCVGGRRLMAQVVAREDGQAVYREATDAGLSAALLEQQQDGVFSVSVGNIPYRARVGRPPAPHGHAAAAHRCPGGADPAGRGVPLDRSGSMSGTKMASAARAVVALIDTLGPADRFAVAAFDDRIEWVPRCGWLSPQDAVVRPRLLELAARGGTLMEPALRDGLAFAP